MRIHHLGVAVESIDKAARFYREALGLELTEKEEVPQEGVRVAFLPAGETRIELLEPLGEGSPIARFMAKRGEGIHHVCFQVESFDDAVAAIRARGGSFIEPVIRTGAGGRRIAFIDPRSAHGVLMELKEAAEQDSESKSFGPGSVVVVYLTDPPSKIWGLLRRVDQTGVAVEGVDLRFFEEWVAGVAKRELGSRDVSLAFYPLPRVEKIILDRGTESVPSLESQFRKRSGRSLGDFLRC